MNPNVYREGKFRMPPMPVNAAAEAEVDIPSAEKLVQAIKLIVSVRTDSKIRDTVIDDALSFVVELLTKVAEGESVEDMLPQEAPSDQKIYHSTRAMGGSVVPAYNSMSPEMQPHQIMAR